MLPETFELWSFSHALAIILSAGLVCALISIRRHPPMSLSPEKCDRILGVLLLVAWIGQTVWWAIPPRLELDKSLPLHLCDLASLAAPFALLSRQRFFRVILYFWGLGLTSQAYFTPTLQEGPAIAAYWLFWLNHFSIVGAALYDVIARGYRPTWGDYGKAMTALLAYGAVMFPVNLSLGWNYGYIGQADPQTPTLLDVIGPWPWRVAVMAILAAIFLAAMTVVWSIPSRQLIGRPRQ
ncbi:MAG: TIGR02206 family membrane protein [Planctomycetes bacterium]|nr:TIGR02206 family membrane protein [Planctomycetota bacterium]NOG54274.1 TIGR02206 family membrane protein [Planctomycetota bacterium]